MHWAYLAWLALAVLVALAVALHRGHGLLARLVRIPQATVRRKRDQAVALGIVGRLNLATATTVVYPARKLANVRVVGVAAVATGPSRGAAAAGGPLAYTPPVYHSLTTFATPQELFAAGQVSAVYIAAQPVQQKQLIEAALLAGKHVLCAAPMCPTAADARDLLVLAAQQRRSLVEDLGYRFHPIVARVRELVHSNRLGLVRSLDVTVRWPLYYYSKAVMDDLIERGQGCLAVLGPVAIHAARSILGSEPRVVKVDAALYDKRTKLDERLTIELVFEHFETMANSSLGDPNATTREGLRGSGTNRVTANIELDLRAWSVLPEASLRILGTECDLMLDNFIWPHLRHQLTLRSKRTGAVIAAEQMYGDGASPEEYQLDAFAREILFRIPTSTDLQDSLKNMLVIDQVVQTGGLVPPGHRRSGFGTMSMLNMGRSSAVLRTSTPLTSPRFVNGTATNGAGPLNGGNQTPSPK